MKRILVLGANGQIGRPLTEGLAAAFPEAEVVAVVRRAPKQPFPKHITPFQFRVFEEDWRILGQADLLVNAIGQIRESPDCTFEQIHQGLVRLILQHRNQLGNPRILQLSALGAHPEQKVAFLRTKGLADAQLLAEERVHILRPSIVCTPDTVLVQKFRMLARISQFLGGILPVPDGFLQTRIQPILIEDLVDLSIAVAQQAEAPALIEAVGPEPISMDALLALIGVEKRFTIRPVRVSRKLLDPLVEGVLASWLPHVISTDQYALLFSDNVGEVAETQKWLRRVPGRTWPFWEDAFQAKRPTDVAKVNRP
ncbi:MAG: hypothetical protein AAFR61_21305 [Bacteroidota bacterium]